MGAFSVKYRVWSYVVTVIGRWLSLFGNLARVLLGSRDVVENWVCAEQSDSLCLQEDIAAAASGHASNGTGLQGEAEEEHVTALETVLSIAG